LLSPPLSRILSQSDPPLQHLGISDNALSGSVLQVARGLKLNATLRELKILDRTISVTHWEQFFEEIKGCHGLTLLVLPEV
jgi:hypothetical protein